MEKSNELLKLHDIFREEADDKMADITAACARLRDPLSAAKVKKEVSALRRHLHNLKGAALSVGFQRISDICHLLEDALRQMDNQTPPPATWECCEDGMTLIGLELQGKDITEMLSRLEQKLARITGVVPAEANKTAASSSTESQNAKSTSTEKLEKSMEESVSRESEEEAEVKDAVMATPERPIKVPVGQLDVLMGCVEELQVTNSRFNHRNAIIAELISGMITEGAHNPVIAGYIQQMRAFLREEKREVLEFTNLCNLIEHSVKQIRMVPLSEEETRWRKVVRESAYLLEKRVDVQCNTGDIRLDKNILDGLGDVLLHILRNAVDHGIESPAVRVAAGKPETGVVRIAARPAGELVQLDISDDGLGPNWERIRKRAVKQGLLAREEKDVDHAQLLELMFSPGFSTAKAVGQVSGRGVGLDVVRTRIQELGGTVTVHGQSGQGTRFRLEVPSSVLSTNGLFVQCGETKYGLPVDYVERTLRVRTDTVQQSAGHDSIVVDGEPVRVISLHSILGKSFDPGEFLTVLLLAKENRKAGVIVDRSHAEQAYISKNLPWNTGQVGAVSGAIVQGDGTLALALDVDEILSTVSGGKDVTSSSSGSARQTEWSAPRVLVVDDSPSIRTLQKSLFANAGYEVFIATDGEEAWRLLQTREFDLLVSDIEMPNMDGITLTRRVRQNTRLSKLPIILVTSRADAKTREAGAGAGADEYIIKGKVDQEKLLEIVSTYI